jgi:hypothetical protein
LVHSGLSETAEVFYKSALSDDSSHFQNIPGAKTIQIRKEIRRLLDSGHIDASIALLQTHFPLVLEEFPRLCFAMNIQKFVEMVRQHTDSMDIDQGQNEYLLNIIQLGRTIKIEFSKLLIDNAVSDALTVN